MAMGHLHTKTTILRVLYTLSRMDHRSRNRLPLLLLPLLLPWTTLLSKSRLSLTQTHSVIIIFHLLPPSSMFNTSTTTTTTTRILHPTITPQSHLVTPSHIFQTRKRHTHIMPIPTLPPASHLRQHQPVRDHLRMHPSLLGHTPRRLILLTRMKLRNRLGIILLLQEKPVSNLFLMRLVYLLGTTTHIHIIIMAANS